jgi:hypothetical protein
VTVLDQASRIEVLLTMVQEVLAHPEPDATALAVALGGMQSLYDQLPAVDELPAAEAAEARAAFARLASLHKTVTAAALAHRERLAAALTQLDRAAIGSRSYAVPKDSSPHFIDRRS